MGRWSLTILVCTFVALAAASVWVPVVREDFTTIWSVRRAVQRSREYKWAWTVTDKSYELKVWYGGGGRVWVTRSSDGTRTTRTEPDPPPTYEVVGHMAGRVYWPRLVATLSVILLVGALLALLAAWPHRRRQRIALRLA